MTEPVPDQRWRVYSEAVTLPGGQPGWLQAGRSLAGTEAALARLRRQLLLGLPIMLVFAAVGGLFLAGRALSPIDRMATAAEQITGSDLSGRMGPQDSEELGRLAGAFDRMLERLDKAFQRERRFVADVSHELRTPLTALRGRIEVTLTRPRSRPEYEETLESLATEVARLTRLSEDLLLLARFDRGAQVMRPEPVDLSVLLASVAGQLRPLAEARGQVLVEDVPPGLALRADPDQLIRLFFNLVDNASKFSADGGRIALTARQDGRLDHGRGARRRGRHRPRAPRRHLRPLLPGGAVTGAQHRRPRPGARDRPGDRPRARRLRGRAQRSRPGVHVHGDATGLSRVRPGRAVAGLPRPDVRRGARTGPPSHARPCGSALRVAGAPLQEAMVLHVVAHSSVRFVHNAAWTTSGHSRSPSYRENGFVA